jgi:hypothetical protein
MSRRRGISMGGSPSRRRTQAGIGVDGLGGQVLDASGSGQLVDVGGDASEDPQDAVVADDDVVRRRPVVGGP